MQSDLPSPTLQGEPLPEKTFGAELNQDNVSESEELRRAAHKVVRRHEKLVQSTQEVDVLLDRAIYAWECRRHKDRFAQESMSKFMDAANALVTHTLPSPQDSLGHLNQLLQQAQRDTQAVTEETVSSRAIEEELSIKQSRLRRKEKAFTRAVQDILGTLGSRGVLSARSVSAEASPSVSPRGSNISPSVHPQLESFYAKVAEVRNLHERLADYQTDYEEEQVNRQLRRDQGHSPEQPDEDFQAAYLREVQPIESALTEASKTLEDLQTECLHKGLLARETLSDLLGDPIDLAAFAAETNETPVGRTPSFPGLELPVITPATLPLLQLEQMSGRDEEKRVRYIGGGVDDIPLFFPARRRENEAEERVNEWLQRAESPNHGSCTCTPTCEHHSTGLHSGSSASSWPMTNRGPGKNSSGPISPLSDTVARGTHNGERHPLTAFPLQLPDPALKRRRSNP